MSNTAFGSGFKPPATAGANPFATAAGTASANPFAAATAGAANTAASGFKPTANPFAPSTTAPATAGTAAPAANPFAAATAANPFKPATATTTTAPNPFAPQTAPSSTAATNPFASTISPNLISSANAGDEVAQQLIQVRKSYDRSDPKSRFQMVFYNKVNPAMMSKVVRPPHANPRLWEQAIINNPSPTTLVPCLVTGFEDLERRIAIQNQAKQRYQELLLLLEAKAKDVQQQQENTIRAEIEQVNSTYLEQSHRLLRLMSLIEVTESADLPLNDAEIDYRRKLESAYKELQKLAAKQRKLTELTNALRNSGRSGADSSLPRGLDPQSEAKLYQYLDSQGDYLEQLAKEVALAKGDVAVVQKSLGSHLDL